MAVRSRQPARQIPVGQVGGRLPALVHDVQEHGPVELTQAGEPVAVVVAVDEYRRLLQGRAGPWAAYERFRSETDLSELDIDEVLDGVRDRSPGRDVTV